MTAWRPGKTGERSAFRFSLDRPVTVVVLFLTLLVVGAVAAMKMPVELLPSGFSSSTMVVYAPWPDAPPQEVEDKVSKPLEEELSTVRGIDRIASVSVHGFSRVFIRFKQRVDLDVAYREIRDRIERARRQFPEEIDQVFIRKEDSSGFPVYVLGCAIDDSVTNVYDLIQNEIILPIERVDGVARVDVNGLEEKEILIELDRERVAAAGLNVYELAQDLSGDNFTMASGKVLDADRRLLLRSVARYDSIEELYARPIRPGLTLADVAKIRYDEPDKDYRVRAMSKPAYAIVVFKEGDANAREISAALARTVESYESNPRLSGVEAITLFSQGEFIGESMGILLQSGAIGGFLAAFVLFLFLRRLRMTAIITFSIPLSILIALMVMFFAGETINIMSLLALMVCVGLLVDNSVVVAENIHRLHGEGTPRRQACIKGSAEIAFAITTSTLTTIVVFLPMALVDGRAQFFMLRLAIPISVALLASLAVALVFVPLVVYTTLADHPHEPGPARRRYLAFREVVHHLYEKSFGRLNRVYSGMLAFFLGRRLELVLVLIVVMGATGALFRSNVEFVEQQENERSGFFVAVEMPDTATLEETEAWFLEAESIVEAHAEELGLEGWFLFHERTDGELQGWFKSPRTVDLTAREVTEKVLDLLPPKAGMELTTGNTDQLNDDDSEEAIWALTLNGENPELLNDTLGELRAVFTRVDGVLGAKRDFDQTPNQLGLVVDRSRAQQAGVNPQVVAGVVGYALRGAALPDYLDQGREVPVRIRFEEQDRESLTELSDFQVPTASGGFLPLSALTRAEEIAGPDGIVRINKKMSRTLTLELEEGKEDETRERLDALARQIDLPEGVYLGIGTAWGGGDAFGDLAFAGILSVVFIYLLMGFLFESFVLPLSIVLTIPLSFIGVAWGHIVTLRDIDFLGAVGIVILVGIVVNNGIVLIDYVNRLRSQGHRRTRAIMIAAEQRFRPIMMTAITTIGGLIPLAIGGRADSGLSYTSFALGLIGGMTTATLLTLLVVPVFYTLFDDLRERMSAMVGTVFIRPAPVADQTSRP